jgi:hypothetical protein
MPDSSTHVHPVLERLLSPHQPFARHALLHDLEQRLARARPNPALATRVHQFVDRGVPYFAPQDAHYRAWAEKAAQLWDELHRRTASSALA